MLGFICGENRSTLPTSVVTSTAYKQVRTAHNLNGNILFVVRSDDWCMKMHRLCVTCILYELRCSGWCPLHTSTYVRCLFSFVRNRFPSAFSDFWCLRHSHTCRRFICRSICFQPFNMSVHHALASTATTWPVHCRRQQHISTHTLHAVCHCIRADWFYRFRCTCRPRFQQQRRQWNRHATIRTLHHSIRICSIRCILERACSANRYQRPDRSARVNRPQAFCQPIISRSHFMRRHHQMAAPAPPTHDWTLRPKKTKWAAQKRRERLAVFRRWICRIRCPNKRPFLNRRQNYYFLLWNGPNQCHRSIKLAFTIKIFCLKIAGQSCSLLWQHNMDYPSEVNDIQKLKFISNFVIMSQYNENVNVSVDLLVSAADLTSRKLLKSIHQILLLRLSHTEFVCLKTLILFRPGEC